MQHPNFWDDSVRAKEMSQKLAGVKKDIGEWEALNKETATLKEFLELGAADAAMAAGAGAALQGFYRDRFGSAGPGCCACRNRRQS